MAQPAAAVANHPDAVWDPQYVGILASNALYVAGVLFFGWDVFDLLVIFWVETVGLGLLVPIRILFAKLTPLGRRLIFAVHFAVAFAMYAAASGLLAFVEFSGLNVPGDRAASIAAMIGVLRGPDVLVFGALLLVAQVQDLVLGYLRGRRYREATAEGEMRYVMVRQSVLLAAFLIGAAFLREQGSPIPGLLLAVVLKTAVEVGFSQRAEPVRWSAPQSETPR